MKHFNILKKTYWLLLIVLFHGGNAWGQVTVIDFETAGAGYTPSTTTGSSFTDVFNRTNADLPSCTNESGFYWAVEDLPITDPSIDLDQIDVTGSTSFTFAIDMVAHHYKDWDTADEMLITYSLDGGAYQNLMWIQSVPDGDAFNSLAALDTDFDGDGECANHLPSLTTGTNGGCTVSTSDFATFTTGSIALGGNSTLDIRIQFIALTATDEGIYLDNITITEAGVATPTVGFDNLTSTDNEGNTINIPVTLTNGSAFPVTLNVAATDLTSEGGDYTINTGTITFNADGTQNVSITFNHDADFDDEMLTLTLTEATATGVTISQDTNNVIIIDDDTPPTIGFDNATSSGAENSSINIPVTLSSATVFPVTISIGATNNTAEGGDYTLNTTTLTFNANGSQNVNITFNDDVDTDNETLTLTMTETTATGVVISQATNDVTIFDDDTPPLSAGLIINEFSNGATGTQEYVELLVTGTPGTVVDIRGWVVDDNNGIFSNGPGSGRGIAQGHLRFKDDCAWENIPVGSLIVIYHDAEKNTEIAADDPTDSDGDYVYILGADNEIIEGNDDASLVPSSSDSNYVNATTWLAGAGAGAQIGMSNIQDGIQVRAPQTSNYGFVHGLSYGFTDSQHPDFPQVGISISAALHWTGGGGTTVWSFTHGTDDYHKDKDNWTSTTANASSQTPGAFNNAANQTFIESLRVPYLPIETAADTDVCTIDAGETKTFYSNGDSDVLGKITNNNGSDYGNSTLSTFLAPGTNGVYTRNFGSGDFYFFERYYTLSVTSVPGTPNYDTRFYYTAAELIAYTNEINALTGASYTPVTILPILRIYKTAGTMTVETAASPGDFEIQTPTFGVQSPQNYAYWEYTGWTGFSGFAIGSHITLLPVEWLNFEGEKVGKNSLLKWTTEDEVNNNGFYVMRSTNGVDYKSLGFVDAQSKNSNNSVFDYQFIDENLPKGIIYYQLKQVDLDGSEDFSNVIEIDNSKSVLELMTIAPNPSKDFFRIETYNSINVDVTVNIMSVEGKFYGKFTGDVNAASDFLKNTSSKLSTGLYIVTLETENDVKHFKVSKY